MSRVKNGKDMGLEPFFDLSDLKRIGEHIVNYCNLEMRSE